MVFVLSVVTVKGLS